MLRERDAQVEYKKKKQESMKGRDVIYVEKAREVRQRACMSCNQSLEAIISCVCVCVCVCVCACVCVRACVCVVL